MAKDVMEVLERMRLMDPFTTNAEQDDALRRVAELIAAGEEFKTLNYTLNRLEAHSISERMMIFDRDRLVADKEKAWRRFLSALAACRGL